MKSKNDDGGTREFQMDRKLLHDVITRQAGSIQKAWLEAVMNSIDAGASRITMRLDQQQSIINDDGAGMSKSNILEHFEVFGAEYSGDERERKRYGEFRMGRGQLFAHGINEWLTGTNILSVDIRADGLKYHYNTLSSPVKGCEITVKHYRELSEYELDEAIEEFKQWIKFVPCIVDINGEEIEATTDDDDAEQTSTDLADYILSSSGDGNIAVYNRGVYVRHLSMTGASGAVITKDRLKVNFARNDIMNDCPVWLSIKPELARMRANSLNNAKYLSEDNKKGILQLLTEDKSYLDMFKDKPIVRLATETYIALCDLDGKTITYAREGDMVAEEVMRRKPSVVVVDERWRRWVDILFETDDWTKILGIVAVENFKEIAEGISAIRDELEDDKLKPTGFKNMQLIRRMFASDGRQILVGKSTCARAWTDGHSKIWLNIDEINRNASISLPNLFHLVCHELAHDDEDGISHIHGDTFFRNYHRLIECKINILGYVMRVRGPASLSKVLMNADGDDDEKESE